MQLLAIKERLNVTSSTPVLVATIGCMALAGGSVVGTVAGGLRAGAAVAAGVCAASYAGLQRFPGYGSPDLPSLLAPDGSSGRHVRVVAMSDTHNALDDAAAESLPAGDVFVHCGDVTNHGSMGELVAFNLWLGKIRHKFTFIVVIAGNHDLLLDPSTYDANRDRLEQKVKAKFLPPRDVPISVECIRAEVLSNAHHFLVDETVTLTFADGRSINVFGSPRTSRHHGSPVNAYAGNDAEFAAALERSALGQPKIDLFITHGPPHQVRDRAFFGKALGSKELASHMSRLAAENRAPAFHIFGHVHEGRGVQQGADLCRSAAAPGRKQPKTFVPTTFINAASVNLLHDLRPGERAAIPFDVPCA